MIGRNIHDALSGVAVLVFVGAVAYVAMRILAGCTPARDPDALPKFCTDETLYTAELVRCVDRAETLAQSQACRQSVDYACGIRQTVKK